MKKAIAFVLVLAFFFVMGIALADEGETKGAGANGGPALNNMANWLMSHFPSHESSAAVKEPAPALSDEELKAQRENTGMGMRGRTK